jgi:hypothetical protein
MVCTVGGKPVLRAEVTENRVANWTALLTADSDTQLTGKQTLDIEGEQFVGTVQQQELDGARWKGLLVGGAGGTHTNLPAAYYYQATAGRVLSEIARESGETLASDMPVAIASHVFPRWARLQGEAHVAVRQVADELGVDWRITRKGELWVGPESWPVVMAKTLTETFEPELRLLTIAYNEDTDRPLARPGVTFNGMRVERVVTTVDSVSLRQDLYLDETRGQAGLFATVTRRVREVMMPKLQLARFYAGRITGQLGDGAVALLMDDREIAGQWKGLDHIPLVFGLPGVTIKAKNGARVRVFFDAGNPSRPRAALFDQGAPVDEITISVTGKLKIVGDVEVTGKLSATGDVSAMALLPAGPITLSHHAHVVSGPPFPNVTATGLG